MKNQQRLFIAITLPDDLLEGLADVQARLKRKLARYPLRWVRPEGIHLTLKFLGDTDPARIPEIVAALEARASAQAPFQVAVGGLGMFPNARRPSVLWVGMQDEQRHLQRLARQIDKAMTKLGWQPEKKAFTAHLTLARVQRHASNGERRALGQEVTDLRGFERVGVLSVRRVCIMRSHLRPGGAVYNHVHCVELGHEI